MWTTNQSPLDLYSLLHVLLPLWWGAWWVQSFGLRRAVVAGLVVIAAIECGEAALARLGLEDFREGAANATSDVALGVLAGLGGLRLGRAEAASRAAARARSLGARVSPNAAVRSPTRPSLRSGRLAERGHPQDGRSLASLGGSAPGLPARSRGHPTAASSLGPRYTRACARRLDSP